MIKHDIEQLLAEAVQRAQDAGDLPSLALPEVVLERPPSPEHGDYASNLALRLARAVPASPLDIAKAIASRIAATEAIASVEVAPPGFINFRLAPPWLARQVDVILAEGEAFGNVPLGQGQPLQVEFVSANPVGPLHVGNGRGLAIGDTLANVLAAAGFQVQREYLVNDAGTQTEAFAATLYARYQQLFGRQVDIPQGGYPGQYMVRLAEEIAAEHGDAFLRPPGQPAPSDIHDLGVDKMMGIIRDDLAAIGVHYDRWFNERSLYESST